MKGVTASGDSHGLFIPLDIRLIHTYVTLDSVGCEMIIRQISDALVHEHIDLDMFRHVGRRREVYDLPSKTIF